jgi:hypothetical protein
VGEDQDEVTSACFLKATVRTLSECFPLSLSQHLLRGQVSITMQVGHVGLLVEHEAAICVHRDIKAQEASAMYLIVPETRKVEIASRLKAEPSISAKRLIIDRIRERHGSVDWRYITGSRIERNVR